MIPFPNAPAWHVAADAFIALFDAQAAVGALAVKPRDVANATGVSTSLLVAVSPGSFRASTGLFVSYAGTASQGLTASQTNYLYLTDAGALTVNTTGFPAAFHVPLAVVIAGTTTLTSVTDARKPLVAGGANGNTVYLTLAGGTFADGSGVAVVHTGTTNGVQFGGSASEKLGFFGATPVVQPSGAAQAAVGALALQTLTVSTGGSASTTLAAATNVATLTDSTGGTASTTLAAVSDAPTANALASLAAQHAVQRALNVVLINAVTSLGTQLNNALADLGTLKTLANANRSAMVALGLEKGSA